MKTLWIAVSISLMVACSSGSGAEDEDTQAVDVTPELGGWDLPETDQREPPEDVVPDDLEPDVVRTTATPQYIEDLCGGPFCQLAAACTVQFEGGDCLASCRELAGTDQGFLEQLVCAVGTGDGLDAQDEAFRQEWCGVWETCGAGFEPFPDCQETCGLLEQCEALAGSPFGYGVEDCFLMCSAAALHTGEEIAEVLQCINAALASCDAPSLAFCMGEPDELASPCQGPVCSPANLASCGMIPDPFLDEAACRASCDDFVPGQIVSSKMCLDFASELPLWCGDVVPNCLAPAAELPAGAVDYAAAVIAKCPIPIEGFSGKLKHSMAAWALEGIRLALPDLLMDYAFGVECLRTLTVCPSADMSLLACLLRVPEAGTAACATIGEVCTPAASAEVWTWDCRVTMAFAEHFAPEGAVTALLGCIHAAETCEGKKACYDSDN
jgi:hypothetical protein